MCPKFRIGMKSVLVTESIILILAVYGGWQISFQAWSKGSEFLYNIQKRKNDYTLWIHTDNNGNTTEKSNKTATLTSSSRSAKIKSHLRRVCSAMNISIPITDYQLINVLVDDTRRVLYCSVPKVASTSWKRIWSRLTGEKMESINEPFFRRELHRRLYFHTLYGPKFSYDRWNMLATYKKFIFVRHPLERIVSAYIDKALMPSDDIFNFPNYFRGKYFDKFGIRLSNETDVSFSDFMKFILSDDVEKPGGLVLHDAHWMSVHKICNPCAIDYDFIGTFEHLAEDTRHVLEWLQAEDVANSLPAPVRPTNATRLVQEYWNQVSRPLKREFLNHYILDYLSFDYEFALREL
ncbi:Sulfotransferase [Halocaridina rubra]|uniref:Carbohydrate sulfotransferase n=1 Tax=Halocaridina rubra TaxID=373956 RepID=A0AAN9ACH3_HALRR